MPSLTHSALRAALPALAASTAFATAAAPAGAAVVEVGAYDAATVTPSCPGTPCLAVSRTTGYQAKVGTTRPVLAVPADGKIVAWSISLGSPDPKQTKYFEDMLGGGASAGIAILRQGSALRSRVVGQSPIRSLTPYFGQTVQFPLGRSLNVRKGYVVALTVPTWAPALQVGLGGDTSWRASRDGSSCDDTQGQTAQRTLGALTRYRCLYRTARLTYSATLVTTPQANEGSAGD